MGWEEEHSAQKEDVFKSLRRARSWCGLGAGSQIIEPELRELGNSWKAKGKKQRDSGKE